ncbi:capsular biosynthesis protein [Bacillus sp. UMB0899]|nr:capsular biosynthesis protein [Bacillus sp. UMB0899]
MFCFVIIVLSVYNYIKSDKQIETIKTHETKEAKNDQEKEIEKQPIKQTNTTITISAAGDFTLGRDETYAYQGSFDDVATQNGLPYFLEGLNSLFLEDDFTTVNLETTLTNSNEKADKTFRFKGDPKYAEILKMGGIETVNLANNHIFDYLEQGYKDTKTALENEEIGYFGYEDSYITKIKGVRIGALGYEGWQDTSVIRAQIMDDIEELREQGAQIILIHFHWGDEKQYVPNETQTSLAKFSIDSGADLILGHHPHVIQGIEEYKGKFIVYSLGNFMFGGNKNPSDKDTFVFQQTFYIENGILSEKKEINVIPFSISSVTSHNNYQPTLLNGKEHERVKEKIILYSNQITESDWLVYEKDSETSE